VLVLSLILKCINKLIDEKGAFLRGNFQERNLST